MDAFRPQFLILAGLKPEFDLRPRISQHEEFLGQFFFPENSEQTVIQLPSASAAEPRRMEPLLYKEGFFPRRPVVAGSAEKVEEENGNKRKVDTRGEETISPEGGGTA